MISRNGEPREDENGNDFPATPFSLAMTSVIGDTSDSGIHTFLLDRCYSIPAKCSKLGWLAERSRTMFSATSIITVHVVKEDSDAGLR